MNILLADDHQSILDAIKAMMVNALKNVKFEITECTSCEFTFNAVQKALSGNNFFDLALLDYSMPAFYEQEMLTGGDLALHIRKCMPNCKVIIFTGMMDGITVFDIIQKVNPEGFVFKSDLNFENFVVLIKEVLEGKIHKSEGIKKMLVEGAEKEILSDAFNRKILYHLGQGFMIKAMSEKIGLSEPAINKRIAKMKKALDVDANTTLFQEAKKRGLV